MVVFTQTVKNSMLIFSKYLQQDAWGCFNTVRRQCQLLQIKSVGNSVVLVGSPKSCASGCILLGAHREPRMFSTHAAWQEGSTGLLDQIRMASRISTQLTHGLATRAQISEEEIRELSGQQAMLWRSHGP